MSFPSDLRRGRLMAHIQQRFEGFVGSAPVERGGDPMLLVHMVGREEPGLFPLRPDQTRIGLEIQHGDFFGSRQSGLPAFRVGDLSCDLVTLKQAQTASAQWIDAHGTEDTPEARALRERIGELFSRAEGTMN